MADSVDISLQRPARCESGVETRKLRVVPLSDAAGFTRFVDQRAPHLKQALMAAFGPDIGDDATAEALAYGWEHWERVGSMANPAGYLYRVGQNHAKRTVKRRAGPAPTVIARHLEPWFEPELVPALRRLSTNQRAAVLLVHGFGWRVTEVAELWGVTFSTVQTHVDRGTRRMRKHLGAES